MVTYKPWFEPDNDVDGDGVEDYKQVFNYADFLTTMDYSDHTYNYLDDQPSINDGNYGLITSTSDVVSYAESINKRVSIGVETQPLSNRTWKTFYEQGVIILEQELALLDDHYSNQSSFGGVSIHLYSSYADLPVTGVNRDKKDLVSDINTTIIAGGTEFMSVLVDHFTDQLRFIVEWGGSTVDATLVTPSGDLITPEDANNDPDIEHIKGATYEVYYISNPEAGNWTVQLFGADIPPEGENVNLTVYSSHINLFRVFLPSAMQNSSFPIINENVYTNR